jgi:hypothetical protein
MPYCVAVEVCELTSRVAVEVLLHKRTLEERWPGLALVKPLLRHAAGKGLTAEMEPKNAKSRSGKRAVAPGSHAERSANAVSGPRAPQVRHGDYPSKWNAMGR